MLKGLFARGRAALDASALFGRAAAEVGALPPATTDPVTEALRTERLGLILGKRAEWADLPNYEQAFATAVRAVDERFAFVPEGTVSLALTTYDEPGQPEVDCETEPFLLARHTVTNEEFQRFVDSRAYEQPELWPEEVWPHLIDFKDISGAHGPRYWSQGRHDRRLARHPVVGICYYEAAAYAQWAGFRLPSEAQWQMAASWRIRSAAHTYRRYPWGDGMEFDRCNIWLSGHGQTLPVDACPRGAAPNGALQLVGNVWEWTQSDFHAADREGRMVFGNSVMKSIRGGAFDTYFAWQATAAFRTGLESLARVHNVGFRCAMKLLAH